MRSSKALLALALLSPVLLSSSVAAQAPVEERVTLAAEDGWNLSARYLKAAPDAPTVVLIHSHKSDLTEWDPWMKAMKRYGFGYLALDLRGHGNSFVMPDGSTTTWRAFSVSGSDNEYNKMLRDVEAALAYLSTNSVSGEQTVLAGSVLGANLAIKAAAIHPEVAMVVAVSPALNANDVLSVNPLRAYGRRPILLIAGSDRPRQYTEFQILNSTAKIACGPANVSVMVEPAGFGPKLITRYNARRVLDWIKNPRLPDVVAYSTAALASPVTGAGEGTPPPTDGEDEAREYEGD